MFATTQKQVMMLIIVVVVMDLMQQIQTHMMSYQYEALMKKVQPKITS